MRAPSLLYVLIAAALPAAGLRAETLVVESRGVEALDAATRDRFIALDRDAACLRLARSYLLTNETGVTGKAFDLLGDSGAARIRFDVPLPGFERGLLLIYNSYTHKGHPLAAIAVNGRSRPYVHDEVRMLTGGWARHDVRPDELRPGGNEVIISGGGLHVDTFSHTGSSARSFDGGKTFNADALGPAGDWAGEYIVRLRMYGHPPAGEVTSPIIDPAIVPADLGIRPKVVLRSILLHADQDVPEGTNITYRVRTGSTPSPSGRTWTQWRSVNVGEPLACGGDRHVQWRARLTTDSSRRTPCLRAVRFTIEADVERPAMQDLRVVEYHNPVMVSSSYPFTWESDTPRIRHLREKYRLADVAGDGDEWKRQVRLRQWVSSQWQESWDGGRYDYCPPWDALELLELAPRGLSMGMCTHLAATYVQAGAAVGLSTRVLIADHHCLAEVWSNALGRWVLQDPGPGRGTDGYAVGFAYQADGRWLNALEVHEALREKRMVSAITDSPSPPGGSAATGAAASAPAGSSPPAKPWPLDDEWMRLFVRFGIPLRNNHLSQPEPAELEHGREQYRWDGYLWWSDSVDDPVYPEYSLLSNRVADFYWPLNQVAVDLQQHDSETLIVNFDTFMPNLARCAAMIDDRPPESVTTGFHWPLHDGDNRLRLRGVNTFGVAGPETRVHVVKRSRG